MKGTSENKSHEVKSTKFSYFFFVGEHFDKEQVCESRIIRKRKRESPSI